MAKITRKIDENTYITEDYDDYEWPCSFFDVIKGLLKALLIAISPLIALGLIALFFTFC